MFKKIICGLGLLVGAGVGAQLAHAAEVAVQPPAMLDELMKSSVGTWKCEGSFTGPDGAQEKMKSTAVIKKELNGNLYTGEFTMPKSAKMPASKSHAQWFYDGVNKNVTMTNVCDHGDTSKSTTSGRNGETSVWTGEGTMMGQPMKMRTTITYKSDKEMTMSYEMDKGGTWVKMGDDVCKK
jgi:hypothetical protein